MARFILIVFVHHTILSVNEMLSELIWPTLQKQCRTAHLKYISQDPQTNKGKVCALSKDEEPTNNSEDEEPTNNSKEKESQPKYNVVLTV